MLHLLISCANTSHTIPKHSRSADRLKRSSDANVKWKVLLTMKQVARSGRAEFRRSLQRHKDAVKACADFRGPPDPLKGNEPYRRVHEASKEALEVMFEAAGHAQSGGGPPGVASRTTGISGGSGGMPSGAYHPGAVSSGAGARPAYSAPAGQQSHALPGQPGYDPNSVLHQPPSSSGTMQGFGNYDPNKVRRDD